MKTIRTTPTLVYLAVLICQAWADPKVIKIEKPKIIRIDPTGQEDESIKILGQFGQWFAFRVNTKRPYCYISASPLLPKEQQRLAARFLVTVQGEFPKGEANYAAGVALKEKTTLKACVGKTTVDLVAQKDSAWTASPDQDQLLVNACQNGEDLVVSGVTANGDAVQHRFALKGFEAAYKAAHEACS